MNIVKLQKQLQNVPDSALIGYVQNPDGQVPTYLALTEISRRKQMRDDYQQQAAPEKSVAESMVEEATGIGAIPPAQPQQMPMQMPPQMAQAPQPQAPVQMAEGGLAALDLPDDMFSEESYASGGIVAFEDGGEVKRFDGLTGSLVQGLKPLTGPRDYRFSLPSFSLPSFPSTEELNAYLADPQAYLADPKKYRAVAEKAAASNKQLDGPYAPNANPEAVAEKQAELLKNRFAPAAGTTADTKPASVGSPLGIGALAYKPYQVDEAGFDALMPEQRSMRDYAAEFKGELGDDPGRAAMKERLAKMQATGEKEAERAPWMALAEAGLGIAAGKSQFALQNIAEGGKQGLKSFAESRDNLRKAEERRFELESKVAQAERAEQLAAINYGADSKRADDQNRRAVGLAKQADKARAAEVNARMEYDSKKDAIELKLKEREINAMDKRIDRQIASMENQSQRNELQNRRDSLKALLQRSSDQLKTMLPDPKNPEYVAAANEYNRYAKQLEDLANQSYSGWGTPKVVKQ